MLTIFTLAAATFLYALLDAFSFSFIKFAAPGVDLSLLLGTLFLNFTVLAGWSALYFGINFYLIVEDQIDQMEHLENQASSAQLAMLRYQLNPHFLFNTLNSISTLVLLKQTERANAMLSRLSSFLRYTLANEPTAHVTVAQEVETLKLYLEIEKMRFEDRLRPKFEIDPAAEKARLPSLLPAALRAQLLAAVPSLATSLVPGQVNTGGRVLHTQGSFAAFLPRFNILYRFSPALNGFATVSKGRRSPTVNLDAAPGGAARISQIAEENVWNYEGGIKGRVGPFTGAASVFYQRYKGFQVSVFENGLTVTRSAGSADNIGVELEGNLAVHRWLSLFATFAYIDGGVANDPANGVFAGNRFRLQPDTTASGGATL
ncbi:hypothetical protein LTR94_027244, partial [Friedmanniomyces endolithicus]